MGRKSDRVLTLNGETHTFPEWSLIAGRRSNFLSCYYNTYKDMEVVKLKLERLLNGDQRRIKIKNKDDDSTKSSKKEDIAVTKTALYRLLRFTFYNPYIGKIHEHTLDEIGTFLMWNANEVKNYLKSIDYDYDTAVDFFSWTINEDYVGSRFMEPEFEGFHLKYDWPEYKERNNL